MKLFDNAARILREIEEAAQKAGTGRVKLVAVTKNRNAQEINALAELGIYDIGENRVQEWLDKRDAITPLMKLHHIGQLQTNKVRYLMGHTCLIHSVDRPSLLAEISRRSPGNVDILLQVNTAREPQKAGVLPEDFSPLFEAALAAKGVTLRGLMCIAPLEGGLPAAKDAFCRAKEIFDASREISREKTGMDIFDTLSMGMSGDYLTAIDCGATLVRIGSALFD